MTKMEKFEMALKMLETPTMGLIDKLNSPTNLTPAEANLLMLHLDLRDKIRDEMEHLKPVQGYGKGLLND